MTQELKKKLQEWLDIKRQADKLEKASKPEKPEGMSYAGEWVRAGTNGPDKQAGAKMLHRKTLANLKAQPKPNLPKSEPTNKSNPSDIFFSEDKKLNKNNYIKGIINQLRAKKGLPSDPMASQSKIDYTGLKAQHPKKIVQGQRMRPHATNALATKINKSVTTGPALVTPPVETNRVTTTQPKVIQSPNTINAYKGKKNG